MKHHFLDQYSEGASPVHRLDPRAKFIAVVAFITALVLTPAGEWSAYGLYLLLIASLALASRVPLMYVVRRSLIVLPFVLVVAVSIPFFRDGEIALALSIGFWHISLSREGLELLGSVLAKAWLSVLAASLLMATTRMADLLKGLAKLRAPRLLLVLMGFMYRYLFVLTDEAQRLSMARDSRHINGSFSLNARSLGHMAGTLFLRSYERGERIYGAMLCRGYDGTSRTLNPLRFGAADYVFTIASVILVAGVNLVRLLRS
jgi:cobalt/nickel transport system permease protein